MLDLHGYGPSIMRGALLTVELAFLSLLVALVLGLVTASAKLSRSVISKGIATFYTTIIRGVPDLVLMLLLFYGGQWALVELSDWLYATTDGAIDFFIQLNSFVSGVIVIGLIFGAYMAETFRGAFMAVDSGQIEAGKAYGMTGWQVFKRILFPQMMRHALPGIGNNWQVLLKTTALVSVIGLEDMVKLAVEAAKTTYEPFIFFIPVAFIYLTLTALSEWALKWLKNHYSAGVVEG
ncbi:MAG: ABC transporter permease [Saccharospirillum sp.]